VLRYAITGGYVSYGDEAGLLRLASRWAADGVDFVQLREKEMDAGELTLLARKLVAALGPGTKLLVNSRADVAIAAGAAGVHLTARPGELAPQQVRRVFALAGRREPVVSVSCHTIEAAKCGRDDGASMIVFAPVFEKIADGARVVEGVGLGMLRRVCEAAAPVKVLALGGVTWDNAQQCVDAGAAGVAGMRLFGSTELEER
jgi:thiamine-phosphate pyrophosphorylase